jgi:hypothetical protein
MSCLDSYDRLRNVCALAAAALFLPVLAYVCTDAGSGSNSEYIPVVPDAKTGWALIPFIGAILLFSSRYFPGAKSHTRTTFDARLFRQRHPGKLPSSSSKSSNVRGCCCRGRVVPLAGRNYAVEQMRTHSPRRSSSEVRYRQIANSPNQGLRFTNRDTDHGF